METQRLEQFMIMHITTAFLTSFSLQLFKENVSRDADFCQTYIAFRTFTCRVNSQFRVRRGGHVSHALAGEQARFSACLPRNL